MEQLECAACGGTAGCAGGLAEATTPASLFLVAGTVVFLYGSLHQYRCHRILAGMKADAYHSAKQPYRLPAGDWFDLVPCGHYLVRFCARCSSQLRSVGARVSQTLLDCAQAELVIYLALTIARRGNSACVRPNCAVARSLRILGDSRACLQFLMLSAIASNLAIGARETQAWYSHHVPVSQCMVDCACIDSPFLV